ncbi:MAG: hypothetical protein R3E32_27965 [Chitinophagales bacterium]
MYNAKNQLHELVKELGYFEDCVSFKTIVRQGEFYSEATFWVKDGRKITEIGVGHKKTASEINASENLLSIIFDEHKDLIIDWEEVKIEAQAGDGLIKLCAYLNEAHATAEAKSIWLQQMESDKNMVEIFDQLQSENHPSVALFGDNLGAKRKATWIEALISKKFAQSIIAPSASKAFRELTLFLER